VFGRLTDGIPMTRNLSFFGVVTAIGNIIRLFVAVVSIVVLSLVDIVFASSFASVVNSIVDGGFKLAMNLLLSSFG